MIARHYLLPNEAVEVDTVNNTIIILYPYGVGNIEVRDVANNLLATLQLWDEYTLPIGSGKYKIVYVGTTEAVVYTVHYFVV